MGDEDGEERKEESQWVRKKEKKERQRNTKGRYERRGDGIESERERERG